MSVLSQSIAPRRGRYSPLCSHHSVRASVVGIVVLTLIPVVLLAGLIARWAAHSERAQMELWAKNQSREVITAIDREIVNAQNMLHVLASSDSLRIGEFEAFYLQAKEASKQLNAQIVVRDLRLNRQILNTAYPWGTVLTTAVPGLRSEEEERLLRAGRPVVSNVFFGPLIKRHFVAVIVPLPRNGTPDLVISVGLPLERFAEILESLDIHPNQYVTVIDRNGTIVTRSEDHARFAATKVKNYLAPDTQSISKGINREGIPFHWFNQRSEMTGWSISVGISDQVLEGPERRAMAGFVAVTGILVVLAIGLAFYWGGRVSRYAGKLGIDREPTREEFEILFESAPNGVMVIGGDGTIVLANSRLENRFGYSRGE